MKRFEVGKKYDPYQWEFEPIKVIKRTEKTIWVQKDEITWMMRIKHDAKGNEYAVDSAVPHRYRDAFTYSALWENKDD